MSKPVLYFLFLFIGLQAFGQSPLPPFASKKITIKVPAFLPGIMSDSAYLKNDTLVYQLQGQIFDKGYKVATTQIFGALSTPWETIFDLANAYANKDKNMVAAIYAQSTVSRVSSFLSGSSGRDFLDMASKAAKSNLRIMAGYKYKNGYLVHTRDAVFGTHENFLVKESGQYKLSALNDSSAMGWNIGLYFKINPAPLQVIYTSYPDSLKFEDSLRVDLEMEKPAQWIAVYKNQAGKAVSLFVQDNGINDIDPTLKKVSFYFRGNIFSEKGYFGFYTSAFNYRPQRVSSNFFGGQKKHLINIY